MYVGNDFSSFRKISSIDSKIIFQKNEKLKRDCVNGVKNKKKLKKGESDFVK